ncbi:MAG: polysaccharide biosynthesis protein [Prolixibacteraceae bacterium]|jgi:FlaA1/EpsC-like NDP-sugar epimerase|nr:polysaccharide biosynthesis protein [Prolixibacteraceae bacterium]MBT6763958.1 polysaccharide biosynthesis protein [Prolixibacteraceae bacterium]MBT6997834.1 polysaccharide biosynthesis protein [Prolixibacteraceae bacterium]MBT7394769.1 polysaccharide biosynthesis protein [Prolixibacteraceae bacterium]
MLTNFNLENFIKTRVTKRLISLLQPDLNNYQKELSCRINGKKILVIGGAGSIGSSYIKAILKFNIKKMVVVDINENGLTELVRDLRSSTEYNIPSDFITYPVNFSDQVFDKLFRQHSPFEIVVNFAAHKHVRSEKDIYSIEAMIENNLFRTRKLLDLLLEFPPEHFFCVSTDKAANPVNIMGASKKLMEELIMVYADKLPVKTARFANVAFSNGSLPLGFLERLNKKQALACPLGIRRFFVSPQESGELCLIASILGEPGDIFYPKLDEEKDMIPFDRIARDLIISLGLEPEICFTEEEARQKALVLSEKPGSWPILFFKSNTSGEKSFEEFFTENEILDTESFVSLGVIKNSVKLSKKKLDLIINNLEDLFKKETTTKAEIVDALKEYLPNFVHIETGKGLDSKM